MADHLTAPSPCNLVVSPYERHVFKGCSQEPAGTGRLFGTILLVIRPFLPFSLWMPSYVWVNLQEGLLEKFPLLAELLECRTWGHSRTFLAFCTEYVSGCRIARNGASG